MFKASILALLVLASASFTSADPLGVEMFGNAAAWAPESSDVYLMDHERILKGSSSTKGGSVISGSGSGSTVIKGSKIKGTKGPKATKAPKGGSSSGRASPRLKRLIQRQKAGEDLSRKAEIKVNKFLNMKKKMKKRSRQIRNGTYNKKEWKQAARENKRAIARRQDNGRLLTAEDADAPEEYFVRDLKMGSRSNKGTKGPKATKAPKGSKISKGLKKLIKKQRNGVELTRNKEIKVNKFFNMKQKMKIRSAEIEAGTYNKQEWKSAARMKMRDIARAKAMGSRRLGDISDVGVTEDAPEEAFVL